MPAGVCQVSLQFEDSSSGNLTQQTNSVVIGHRHQDSRRACAHRGDQRRGNARSRSPAIPQVSPRQTVYLVLGANVGAPRSLHRTHPIAQLSISIRARRRHVRGLPGGRWSRYAWRRKLVLHAAQHAHGVAMTNPLPARATRMAPRPTAQLPGRGQPARSRRGVRAAARTARRTKNRDPNAAQKTQSTSDPPAAIDRARGHLRPQPVRARHTAALRRRRDGLRPGRAMRGSPGQLAAQPRPPLGWRWPRLLDPHWSALTPVAARCAACASSRLSRTRPHRRATAHRRAHLALSCRHQPARSAPRIAARSERHPRMDRRGASRTCRKSAYFARTPSPRRASPLSRPSSTSTETTPMVSRTPPRSPPHRRAQSLFRPRRRHPRRSPAISNNSCCSWAANRTLLDAALLVECGAAELTGPVAAASSNDSPAPSFYTSREPIQFSRALARYEVNKPRPQSRSASGSRRWALPRRVSTAFSTISPDSSA